MQYLDDQFESADGHSTMKIHGDEKISLLRNRADVH